jgi:hypothetical protein
MLKDQHWLELEVFARNKCVWKHDYIWKVLHKEILENIVGDFVNIAIVILKGMLFNSKRDHTDEVIRNVKKFYLEKLEQILSSGVDKLIDLKSDVKQILEYILEKKERFNISWKAATEIRDNQQYTRPITSFVTVLIALFYE